MIDKKAPFQRTPEPAEQTEQSQEGDAGLWRAIRSVMRTQRRAPALKPIPRGQPLPLSFAQQRLWFLDQLQPGNTAYNLSYIFSINAALDVAALEYSLNCVIQRHEALRTIFIAQDGVACQMILPALQIDVPLYDLRDLPPSEREAQVERRIHEAIDQPFDLGAGPLLRAMVLRLSAAEHLLVIGIHHIVFDGTSKDILWREIDEFYRAYSAQSQPDLPDLSIQYADFAAWQRGWLQGEHLDAQLKFWKQHLAGAPAALELPTDRSRPAVQTFAGARYPLLIASALTGDLRALAQRVDATLFMVLLAAFDVLLLRYTGQTDIVVGSPISGRNRGELEHLVGLFVNTRVLRADLSGNPSFDEVLRRVQQVALETFAHQDIPFEKLVEELQPQRDPSRSPLFQVAFNFSGATIPVLKLGDLEVKPLVNERRMAQFDLSLVLREDEDQIFGALDYNTDLFEQGRIARMAEHFQILLTGLAADSSRPVGNVPLLTSEESEQLRGWNAATEAAIPPGCVHDLVTAQARRTPDAVAVRGGAESLTYAELHARATQLASYLRAQGVGRETLVGLCLDRSVDLVVAVLAVWQAGAAYVPLDPTYPAERLVVMIADAGLALLLTQDSLRDVLPATALPVVCLDRDAPAIAATPPLPPVVSDGAQLAYVLYTSGSTGRPKGVLVEHRAVVNFLHTMQEAPGLDATDVLLSVTTLAFDISVLELVLPLTVGAQVVLVDRTVASDGVALGQALTASGATIMQATPATWRLLRDSGWAGRPELRVLSGGEALTPDLAAYLLPRVAAVWNLYGPTETTIWSTRQPVRDVDGQAVPIGWPVGNTQLYVLDVHGQAVPIGVVGELLIGGAGVARGYRNRPDLTAERFVPDPFSVQPGARLYCTGDLVRYR
ncbi:MAG TPA: amino acid adenylation domain-containing protein, partial [Herpetosiphonaceae bacterium]